jgi:hypothetical protein
MGWDRWAQQKSIGVRGISCPWQEKGWIGGHLDMGLSRNVQPQNIMVHHPCPNGNAHFGISLISLFMRQSRKLRPSLVNWTARKGKAEPEHWTGKQKELQGMFDRRSPWTS